MWALYLNPLRANVEACSCVAWAESKEALEKFVAAEKVEPYINDSFSKFFRKDGPLEWYNLPEDTWNESAYRFLGTLEDAIANITQQWLEFRAQFPFKE